MIRARLVILAIALSTSVVGLASAKPGAPKSESARTEAARDKAKRGYTLYDVGKYLEASIAFEEAYTLRPDAGLLFNAAQAARLGGDLPRAQTLYSSYVSFHPDGANLAEAKLNLEKIDSARKERAKTVTTPPPKENPVTPVVEPPIAQTPVAHPPRRSNDKPLLKKWWFWTAIAGGVVVVGGAVALGVVLTRPAPAWNNLDNFGPGAATSALQLHY